MNRLMLAGVALAVSLGPAWAAGEERCKVTDPTGTPLNVREKPNGKIVGTLPNNALVKIVEQENAANGKPWVRVVDPRSNRPIGWVFREFVSCY